MKKIEVILSTVFIALFTSVFYTVYTNLGGSIGIFESFIISILGVMVGCWSGTSIVYILE